MSSSLLAYLTFTFILVVTPGSTTAVVVRNTLKGGRTAGLAAAAGAAIGNSSHATAAGLGLAVVFARWPLALTVLRIAGAAYLAWLGAVSMYRVVRHADGGIRLSSASDTDAVGSDARTGSFRQGVVVTLLSPAIATFYLVVVPSFVPVGAPAAAFAMLAAMHIGMAFGCHAFWAMAMDTLRGVFREPLARRIFEGATGVALLGLAIRIVVKS